MAGNDKQRCKADSQRGWQRWQGQGGERLLSPPALEASGGSRPEPGGDMGEEGAGVGRVCPMVYLFICLAGLRWGIWELSRPVHLCGQSRCFSLPCRSQRRTALASPPWRPSCPREWQGSSARVAWLTPCPFLPTANWERRNPPRAAAGWVGNTPRHLFPPFPVLPSRSMCRHQKDTLISNSLEDEFFCVMDFGAGSNKAKAIPKLLPSP